MNLYDKCINKITVSENYIKFNQENSLVNTKIKTFNDCFKDLFGFFSDEAKIQYALLNNCSLELANIYLKNAILSDDDSLKEKYSFVHGYPKFYENKDYLFIKYSGSLTDVMTIEKLKEHASSISFLEGDTIFLQNSYLNKEEEVFRVAQKIASLVFEKRDNIYIYYNDSTYESKIRFALSLFNIDLENLKYPLIALSDSKRFIEALDKYDSLPPYEAFSNILNDLDNSIIKNEMIGIFNHYVFYEDCLKNIKHLVIEEISTKKISNKESNVIHIGFPDDPFDATLFVLGAIDGEILKTYRDDDFLSDDFKMKKGIPTSNIQNEYEKKGFIASLSFCKEVYLSYPIKVDGQEKNPFINNLDSFIVPDVYTKKAKEYKMGLALDRFNKYKVVPKDKIDEEFFKSFKGYSSKYNGTKGLEDYKLSYTSLNEFYTCPFLYYLTRVLYINIPNENEESMAVGSLFHKVLEDGNTCYLDEMIKNASSSKEKFYLKKYHEILSEILKINRPSKYISTMHEATFQKRINNIIFEGKIDNLMTYGKKAIVVDYKTGNKEASLDYFTDGIDMQLILYFYLINGEYEPVGGYLVKVLPSSVFKYNDKKDYQMQMEEYFKFDGFSIDKEVSNIDTEYEIKSYLKGVKAKKGGGFTEASKNHIINEEEMKKLIDMAENLVVKAIKKIKNGMFSIVPRKNNYFDSCLYCQYKPICYRRKNDYEEIIKRSNLSFLRGEDNED